MNQQEIEKLFDKKRVEFLTTYRENDSAQDDIYEARYLAYLQALADVLEISYDEAVIRSDKRIPQRDYAIK